MAQQVLAVQLVPETDFAELLSELRKGDREVRIVALAAAQEVATADETIDWRRYQRGKLLAELREREFDTVVVAHGPDHYATRAYWKAAFLARAATPRELVLCEGGTLAGRHGIGTGARRAFVHVLQECVAGVLGLVVLVPLVLGAAMTDVFAPGAGHPGRTESAAEKR